MKMEYAIFCALICQCFILSVSCGIYTGTYNLQKLLKEEKELIKALEKFIMSEKNDQKSISSDVETFHAFVKEANIATMTDETNIEHPVNAFHLIHRVVTKWSSIFDETWWKSVLISKHAKEFNETLYNASHYGVWPSEDDVKGAAIALLRLRKCYQLDLFELFAGNISGVQGSPLSYNDVITICKLAHEANMHYDVILWLEKYIDYTEMNLSGNKTEFSEIFHLLAKAYEKYGMPWKSLEILEPLLPPRDGDINCTYRNVRTACENLKPEHRTKSLQDKQESIIEKYHSLCRNDLEAQSQKSSLKCFLRKTKIPLYLTKEEVVNIEPRVSIFHDVISEKEIAFLRNSAKNKLKRSQVRRNDGNASGSNSDYRISSTAWFNITNDKLLRSLDRRIGIITGLNTEFKAKYSDIEQFQVLNYGIGGMYQPHYDFVNIPQWRPPYEYDIKELRGSGDRIATWIFYLSDVKLGGATVFPYLNARIPVVKGAAAFWYNLKPSGDIDPQTIHAGCPVLVGSKWISNRWIREFGQIFTRPCGLSRFSTDWHPAR